MIRRSIDHRSFLSSLAGTGLLGNAAMLAVIIQEDGNLAGQIGATHSSRV
jgi:hypothetical protein